MLGGEIERGVTFAAPDPHLAHRKVAGAAGVQIGDGSVLDHSIILFGSGMSESDLHLRLDIPTLLAGTGAGLLKGNRHIKAPKETPVGNLLLDIANKFGCEIDSFGLSTGRMEV